LPEASSWLDWLDAKSALLLALGVVGVAFTAAWCRRFGIGPWGLLVGVITDFFDTLGIGSFATTTALWRARKTVDDRLIPGTLNVGHTLPTIAQAYIYVAAIEVEMKTLISMIAAAVAGSWLGAGVVAKWPRVKVRVGMGVALLALGAIMAWRTQFGDPRGGAALGVSGITLAVGLACNFVLGALMTMGIGLYAPCLLLVAALGMDMKVAFPIMMGSCAFLMPIASFRFIREGSYDPKAAIALTIGGVPAVFAAALIVKDMELATVKWLVVVVVAYTAVSLLLAARAEKSRAAAG